LNEQLPLLRQQVAQLQALSKKAAGLSDKPVQTVENISREAIATALARYDLKPNTLHLNGDYITVRLASVSFASTLSWLNDMQTTTQLFVHEAKIVALTQPDKVDVIMTLRQIRDE
jgi:type II secretory pathway component PulM